MADKQKLQCSLSGTQLRFNLTRQWSRIPYECLPVKPVMDRNNIHARPPFQFGGKGFARSNRDIGPVNRPLGRKRSEVSIRPGTVLMPAPEIAEVIAGCIDRIPRQQYLRHRRFSESKIP